MRKLMAAPALLLAMLAAQPSHAEQSAYTPLDLGACRQIRTDPGDPLASGIWHCSGYLGIPVAVWESDLRFFVSYGDAAAKEPAAQQTLPPFNTIGGTIEWRLDDDGEPFATILRFFADNGDGPATQVLVVTRLGEGGVCHVAYVNASANADANAMARQIADLVARNFSCAGNRPLWVGERGEL